MKGTRRGQNELGIIILFLLVGLGGLYTVLFGGRGNSKSRRPPVPVSTSQVTTTSKAAPRGPEVGSEVSNRDIERAVSKGELYRDPSGAFRSRDYPDHEITRSASGKWTIQERKQDEESPSP